MTTLLLGGLLAAPAAEPRVGAAEPPAAAVEENLSGVAIVKGLLCTAIADREAADPRESGAEYEARMDRIYYWNAAEVSGPPRRIRHVWSVDGKVMAEIRLELKHPRTRTWSSKQVFPGDWKVEAVAEDGEVLATALFRVR